MTLRARLTATFLVVVLGPVMLGAVFVGMTVAAVSRSRAAERVDVAAAAARGTVLITCQRLRAVAETAALLTPAPAETANPGTPTGGGGGGDGVGDGGDALGRIVDRGLATAVELVAADGTILHAAGMPPSGPWALCDGPAPLGPYDALGVRVEIHDAGGRLTGVATAAQRLDHAFVAGLSGAGGADITVLGAGPFLSTELDRNRRQVGLIAVSLRRGEMAQTSGGRSVRRLDPEPGQPLTLAISVDPGNTSGLDVVLVAVVLVVGLLAVGAAWWLGQTTIRPLTELARAADRVAAGDLAARVPVRSPDEVGRLGTTFNRMTREMQGYIQALTASRDQLRRQLVVLGDTLSSTHDLQRILQVILQTATAATGARAGVVLFADPVANALTARCGEGLPDVTNLRIALGEGLLGSVAITGEPRRGLVERDGPLLSPREPACRTYIAVPFVMPSSVAPVVDLIPGPMLDPLPDPMLDPTDLPPTGRGVLALYDRHGFDEFDDADLTTLRTFAGQAAVALDNVRVHEEAQRLSLTDPLTGLSNYRYLHESLRREVERASRFGRNLAVLVMDLDRFKEINDSYGHAAGDAVLAEFARRVRAEIREVDFGFRQGGEEFVVLLPETDAQGGAVVAQRLCAAVRRTPVLVISAKQPEPVRIAVTVSIGVAIYPDHGPSGPAVLEAADDALYVAKAAGRDTHRIAQPPP